MRPADHYDSNQDAKNVDHLLTARRLAGYLWPKNKPALKARVIGALFFLAGAKVLNVYVPFLLKEAIDRFTIQDVALALPLALIIGYTLARLCVQVFNEVRDLIFVQVQQFAQRTIGLETFRHIHNLSLEFHLSRQTGGLSRVIERGTRGIQFVLRFLLFNILPTILELTMITAVLVYYFDYRYALVVFGTIAAYVAVTFIVTEWRLQFRRKMNKEESTANTRAIDSLLNFETVKYFNNEDHEYQRFDRSLASYEKAAIKSQYSLSFLNVLQGGVVATGLLLMLLMAGQGVVNGDNTVGDFVLVNTYLIQLYLPLNFLGFVYREIKQSMIDMDKMFELINLKSSVQDKPGARPLQVSAGAIRFQDVDFSYNKDRQILHQVSFAAPAGSTIAIVGASGSGKSTIARILYRFYELDGGSVTIDGQNIAECTQESLRKALGIVPQDTVLFNDTIMYNIRYGDPGASDEAVFAAARMAELEPFIAKLPKKYDTMVGERGLKLSGGEKQRVAIARTILKNPKILIFDEATSALDSHTEQEIQKSLRKVARNRTTLVIAHRLSTIVDADQILVLENGRIAEQGRHDSLVAKGGLYASMWARQQEARHHENELNRLTEDSAPA